MPATLAQAQGAADCTAVSTPDAADIHLSLEDAFTRQAEPRSSSSKSRCGRRTLA